MTSAAAGSGVTRMSLQGRVQKYVHDWKTFPADAALAYRREGLRGLWDTVAPRSVYRVVRSGRMIVFSQPLDELPDVALPSGVTIAPLGEGDWPALASLVPQRELDRFRLLVSGGRICLVAWRGSRPIGYAWVAQSIDADVTLCHFPLPAHAAYLWDLYVEPAERCNGIGSALASARLRTAREQGFREGWRMIAPSNRASLRTLEKSGRGTRVVGELHFLKILTRMYIRLIGWNPAPEGTV
jgi:GNAT superfamily N-acetyltransferase